MNTVTDPMQEIADALAFREAFVLAGIADALESTRAFTEAVEAERLANLRAASEPGNKYVITGNDSIIRSGGQITQEQFAQLAMCESGTDVYANPTSTGGWRTGLYGEEQPGSGSLSIADQQALAQQIFDDYGPNAWGVSCRGILG